jgi:NAD(P)-dependent dehydrogenase (short-subunit alcohol dehydrogenase family)
LDGKTFVIAGGATGIGAGTAKRLADEGASVAVGDINIGGARPPSMTSCGRADEPSP